MRLTVLLFAMGACSSSTSGTGSPSESPCVTPASSYTVHFVEKAGGTCGPIGDTVINTTSDGKLQPTPGCTGTRTVDRCAVTITRYTCTPSNGVTTTETGEVTWASDGSSGSGTVDVSIASGATTCSSSYVVTYTRQ